LTKGNEGEDPENRKAISLIENAETPEFLGYIPDNSDKNNDFSVISVGSVRDLKIYHSQDLQRHKLPDSSYRRLALEDSILRDDRNFEVFCS
jgi:hypothetical protein